MRGQHDVVLRRVRFEGERAGADRVGNEVIRPDGLVRSARDDIAAGVVRHLRQEERLGDGLGYGHLEGAVVTDREGPVLIVARVGGGIRVRCRLEGEEHIIDRQGCGVDTVGGMDHHVVANGERPGLGAVLILGRGGHLGRDIGLELIRCARDKANETVEHHVDDRPILGRRRVMRVHIRNVGHVHDDAKDLTVFLGGDERR